MIKYTLKILGFCTAAVIVALAVMLLTLHRGRAAVFIVPLLVFGVAMFLFGNKLPAPEDAFARYFPYFLPLYAVCVWVIGSLVFTWRPLPLNSSDLPRNFALYTFIVAAMVASAVMHTLGAYVRDKALATGWRRFLRLPVTLVVLCLAIWGLDTYHASHSLRVGGGTQTVREELTLWSYSPFREGNQLVRADFEPSLVIDSSYPRLDGATAAYPVYAAMAETLYKGLDEDTAGEYVVCNRTDGAFERLIAGEADVIFGVQPSKEQRANAEAAGVTLIPIKVSREAFVFFVNTENTVENLSVEEIQRIYTKEITDWRELGGKNGEIIPYQRAKNSGSQTIMENVVMRDVVMAEPLMDENIGLMGEMMDAVASYRNYSGAIGYSFRYYATVMNPNDNLQLLSVNGVAPTPENIRSGDYPFTVDVYAYTTEAAMAENPNIALLMDWVVSEEGQRLIELSGYVAVE